MKVIFLDVDGVLAPHGMRGLCGVRIALLAAVVRQTGAEVVLSSTWRYPHCREQRMRLRRELWKHGVQLRGMLPILDVPVGAGGLVQASTRGEEIRAWLAEWERHLNVERYVILDDDPNDEMGDLKDCLVKCDGWAGLTKREAEEMVRRLG